MNLKQNYHLSVLSGAPIIDSNRTVTELAKIKGQLLIELATRIEQEEAAEKAKAEAEQAAEQEAPAE